MMAAARDADGYGNAVPVETTNQFPQGLGNLARITSEIPTFPQPILFLFFRKRQNHKMTSSKTICHELEGAIEGKLALWGEVVQGAILDDAGGRQEHNLGEAIMDKNVALASDVLEQADRLARAENKTVDELANEAVRRYALEKIVRYGRSRARALGLRPQDVDRLITESRKEAHGR